MSETKVVSETKIASETKVITCSMTKANKILSRIREFKNQYSFISKKRRTYEEPIINCTTEISFLLYNQNDVEKNLQNIADKFNKTRILNALFEKIKNKIFALNIKYGIHNILSEIDVLKLEKKFIEVVIEECDKKNARSLGEIQTVMELLETNDKKYEYKWHVTPFNKTELSEQLRSINKKLHMLDEKRDMTNISSTFSIELSPEEYLLLELE